MGKYTKKHDWGFCEFTYTISRGTKKPGDKCGAWGMKRQNGKALCSEHNPDRMARSKRKCLMKRVKTMAKQEARLQELKKFLEMGSNAAAEIKEECHVNSCAG